MLVLFVAATVRLFWLCLHLSRIWLGQGGMVELGLPWVAASLLRLPRGNGVPISLGPGWPKLPSTTCPGLLTTSHFSGCCNLKFTGQWWEWCCRFWAWLNNTYPSWKRPIEATQGGWCTNLSWTWMVKVCSTPLFSALLVRQCCEVLVERCLGLYILPCLFLG